MTHHLFTCLEISPQLAFFGWAIFNLACKFLSKVHFLLTAKHHNFMLSVTRWRKLQVNMRTHSKMTILIQVMAKNYFKISKYTLTRYYLKFINFWKVHSLFKLILFCESFGEDLLVSIGQRLVNYAIPDSTHCYESGGLNVPYNL